MTYPGRPAVTPFNHGDRVTFDNDPTGEVLTVVNSGPYGTTVSTSDGSLVSHGTYLLSPAPLDADALAAELADIRSGDHPRWPRDSFDEQAEVDMARARLARPKPPARRAVYPPGQVIREMREVARMDHPWIPGARAVLIRDAAALLESQEDALARLRARVVELAFNYEGSHVGRPFADDLRDLLDLIPPPAL